MNDAGTSAFAESVIAEAAADTPDPDTAQFIRRFYAHTPPGDLVGRTPAELAAAARDFLAHARTRRGRLPKIRVHTPRQRFVEGKPAHTVIEIVNDDMPFLVDSVTAELNAQGMTVHLVVHPIVTVRRDAKGKLQAILPTGDSSPDAAVESWMRVEVDQHTDPEKLRAIRRGLRRVLADVRAAVEDWEPMLSRARATIARLAKYPPGPQIHDLEEGRAFLEWLADDHFIFLGYREYRVIGAGRNAKMTVVPDSGLGVLRDAEAHVFEGVRDMARLPDHVRTFFEQPDVLIVNKANVRSTVHRRVHLDAVGVKRFDDKQRVVGEQVFVGLFTSSVYTQPATNVPLLRLKIRRALARAAFAPNSHDYKALAHIYLTFPRDELFQISSDDLFRIGMGVVHLQERQRVALFVRHDDFRRFASCLVYVPRDRYTTTIRRAFQAILEEAFQGPVTAFYTQVSDESVLARLHFIVKTDPAVPPPDDVGAIEGRLFAASRSWRDNLREELVTAYGEEDGLALLAKYGDAFGVGYCADNDCTRARLDIVHIERANETGILQLHMYPRADAPPGGFRFRIYNRGGPVPLSDVLPMLEHMGLKVIDERPSPVAPKDGPTVWLHDFGVVPRDAGAADPLARRDAFEEAFARVWAGDAEDDGFNALVLRAGLDWREVVVLRALAAYLRKIDLPFDSSYLQQTLADNPHLARLIVDLFRARARNGQHKKAAAIRAAIERELEQVASLDEDRIVRRFANLVEAMLRTNFFQTRPDGTPKPHLSFKFDSHAVDAMPLPRPMVEIWVYSPRVEGIHLRFGKVARGGLRWSDRREDFRTEVLGLAKAQVVKNAVIVPVGSKGGFVVKRPPAEGGHDAVVAEGIECYKTFIRGMLDLTDNIKAGRVVHPRSVVRHDGDDPYLVVAADKGTASFSDIANAVSEEYGFWLGDAFASGGSAGYDHKKMGITARGAWEAVKRHFREIGIDTQSQGFTVAGIGSMSGDVFGNGMLLSPHIRLVAAFNHLHIFLDPDPDPAVSFAERRRLFDGVHEWGYYDLKKLSKGGGVFDRKAKSIALSPQIRALLRLDVDRLTPNELMRAILRAPVDLLWFGGIGTYVRGSDETDAEVGDRANDALRIEASELGARVVGEGANLGMTQRARVEYALRGGRLNTDAIDNSAGVDCSDHEVNIKIALGDALAHGELTLRRRNNLLEAMTDAVGALVLRDNYLQTACLSVSERVGASGDRRFVRLMRALEREGVLSREVEFLPDDETVENRMFAGKGLTRPELAVLLSFAKIALFDELLDSDLPEDPYLGEDLVRYFPAPLQRRFRRQIERHRLRREIIATVATNSTINRAGISLVHDLKDETGHSAAEIVRAYVMCRESFDLRAFWAEIEALDNKLDAAVQIDLQLGAGKLIKRATRWFLRNAPQPLDVARMVRHLQPGLRSFGDALEAMVTPPQAERLAATLAAQAELEVPDPRARRVAEQAFLLSGCDVVSIAHEFDRPIRNVGRLYFAVGERFGLDWLREAAATLEARPYWEKRALDAMIEDLYGYHAALVRSMLHGHPADPRTIEGWCQRRGPAVDQVRRTIDDLRTVGEISVAMLAVAAGQLRGLVAG
jgi:glutamate dehydrogenase